MKIYGNYNVKKQRAPLEVFLSRVSISNPDKAPSLVYTRHLTQFYGTGAAVLWTEWKSPGHPDCTPLATRQKADSPNSKITCRLPLHTGQVTKTSTTGMGPIAVVTPTYRINNTQRPPQLHGPRNHVYRYTIEHATFLNNSG